MKSKTIILAAAVGLVAGAPLAAQAGPKEDLKAFREYFMKRFPGVPLDEFANGVYAIDAGMRSEWEQMEEFPPYELGLDVGKAEFYKKFKNGKSIADCFPNAEKGIKQNYPYWDPKRKEVVTLELAINECRKANGEKPYKWKTGKLAAVSAYIGYLSRGKRINVVVPENDPDALAWYERGKRFFYAKRGQLNFSCADCHVVNAGRRIRANLLSPALGHLTHFPVYRKKWEAKGTGPLAGFGTPHRRYGGCNKQVRAKPFKAQSVEYRSLEYFHTYMSNGLPVNAPGVRQ